MTGRQGAFRGTLPEGGGSACSCRRARPRPPPRRSRSVFLSWRKKLATPAHAGRDGMVRRETQREKFLLPRDFSAAASDIRRSLCYFLQITLATFSRWAFSSGCFTERFADVSTCRTRVLEAGLEDLAPRMAEGPCPRRGEAWPRSMGTTMMRTFWASGSSVNVTRGNQGAVPRRDEEARASR